MKVLSTNFRPHLLNDNCWCRPKVVECPGCGEEHWFHRQVEACHDSQPRMAVFSDQAYEADSSIGVVI